MIEDYVIPLFFEPDMSAFIGTAFLIDNYLITAGHVVPNFRTYYVKNNNEFYPLDPYNWRIRLFQNEIKHNDIAIYRFDGVKSPLSLSAESPHNDSVAKIICWQQNGDSISQIDTDSLILGKDVNTNFYKLATIVRITHGSSGCPILQGNKVVGMLTMGNDSCIMDYKGLLDDGLLPDDIYRKQKLYDNTCYILRPEFIKDIIDKRS